jgi:hypothetical protein
LVSWANRSTRNFASQFKNDPRVWLLQRLSRHAIHSTVVENIAQRIGKLWPWSSDWLFKGSWIFVITSMLVYTIYSVERIVSINSLESENSWTFGQIFAITNTLGLIGLVLYKIVLPVKGVIEETAVVFMGVCIWIGVALYLQWLAVGKIFDLVSHYDGWYFYVLLWFGPTITAVVFCMWPCPILFTLLWLAGSREALYEVGIVGTVMRWVWKKVCAPVIRGSLFVFGLDGEVGMDGTGETVTAEVEP